MDESETDAAPEIPAVLPVLPLRDTVVFPMAIASLAVNQPRSVQLVDEAQRTNRLVALVSQRREEATPAMPEDVFRVGTAAIVHHVVRAPDGTLRLVVQGLERIRIGQFLRTEPYLVARVASAPPKRADGIETEALVRTARELFRKVVEEQSPELAAMAEAAPRPDHLVALIVSSLSIDTPSRQAVLEEDTLGGMLRRLLEFLQHEAAVRDLQSKVTTETRRKITQVQKEHILREQLETIRHELGEGDQEEATLLELEERLARAELPEEARREASRELGRLRRIPAISPEHGIVRTFLEWVADLPWQKTTGTPIDIARAREALDADHHDLDRVKDRILEYLAVKKLRDERAAAEPVPLALPQEARAEPILCLVGPPGVGKTSLGQSIARAMDRKFVRISLGGIHDEAEIRGHRRTYIGAMPGRILQAIRRVGTSDPIFMLDEVDKLGVGFHGDPSAALLEVLDPAQNNTFTDTYLGVAFDLSRVLFLCTANTIDTIPPALLDRMELIRLPGYTDEDKLQIARRFLVPKVLRANGLRPDELALGDDALRKMTREYTREAGVRSLERVISEVVRKVAKAVGEGQPAPGELGPDALRPYLGPPRFFDEVAERIDRPGVAMGLAWTPVGGEVLFVEAAMMPGHQERLLLTGMLGDVMRESAQAALTWVRSNAERLGVDPRVFRRKVVHLHVPAGAIPKDGPSAGVALLAALASLLTGRTVRGDVAMTGEVTLRGKVLPVGGIKEKVLAAHRVGLRRVVLPRRNEGALEDVPEEVKRALQFVLVDSADEVIASVIGPLPSVEAPSEVPQVH